uniref:Uncharacterized protein n=1 Tax=Tanacetum cinerariifolium TaxID=118510 RepID=A0A6L2NWU2_TANCI|nr:hypothetical protein [Tanacetum cinerariifolium]
MNSNYCLGNALVNIVGNKMLQVIPTASDEDSIRLLSATITLANKVEDLIRRNNKWYQSLVRSFDEKKKNKSSAEEENGKVKLKLVDFKNQEVKYYEKIRGLEFMVEARGDRIECLINELELLKKEKEGLKRKLTAFQSASKDLDSLLESQRSNKNKEGLGYSNVPSPPTQVYSPPKKDLSWTGIPEFTDDTVTDYSRPSPAIESTSNNVQNINSSVTKTESSPSTISSKPFIKFVKAAGKPIKDKIDKVETAKKPIVKYAKQYRKPSKKSTIRGNQRN